MQIKYCNYQPKICRIDFELMDEVEGCDKDPITFEGFNGEFLCQILNKNYSRIFGLPSELLLPNRDECFDKNHRIDLYLNDPHLLEKERLTRLQEIYSSRKEYVYLINKFETAEIEQFKTFSDFVLLNNDTVSTISQRLLAYQMSFKDPLTGNIFEAWCKFYCYTPNEFSQERRYADLSISDLIDNGKMTREDVYKIALNQIQKLNLEVKRGMNYEVRSIFDLFSLIVSKMADDNDPIMKCAHCGKYFYSGTHSNMKYCDNASPEDSSKTCGEYCKYVKYLEKNRNDEATKLYKQIYNIKANKVRRCANEKLKSDLDTFTSLGKKWKQDVKLGEKEEEDYVSWLKAMKEGVINGEHSESGK